ncbi:hypothetical protein GT347_04160 [Xylophilus rhododendri]|uniref:Uncharacterized protein n=1 Tax=Xylophilus rhododendri TaxID=2697032 RepID=A0A857J2E6_9BURK|nr:hypothetical protein [Xylophilus rhododendri]QHI97242.1 hypothetical protein GT347_04160 [Xylophilus rhododendri]
MPAWLLLGAAWLCLAAQAAPLQMLREMPAGFRGGTGEEEYHLHWQARSLPDVVLVQRPGPGPGPAQDRGDAPALLLLPASLGPLVEHLGAWGFEPAAARAWAEQPEFQVGARRCIAVVDSSRACVDVWLEFTPQAGGRRLDLVAADRRSAFVEAANPAYALIGSSSLWLGRTGGGGSLVSSQYLGLASRGIASRGDTTFEYDLSAQAQQMANPVPPPTASSATLLSSVPGGLASYSDENGRSTALNYRLLAVGRRLGDTARGYAGVFTATASGALWQDAGSFFARPSILGLAYRSNGGQLTAYGGRSKVRLLLRSDSYVRIVSNGTELFAGPVPAGEQWVEFEGYADAFVEASVRDAGGRVEQRTVEVVSTAQERQTQPVALAQDRSMFYVDAGQVMSQLDQDNRHLDRSDVYQASAFYTYASDARRYQASAQWIAARQRLAFSMGDRASLWSLSSMAGSRSEYGLRADATVPLVHDLRLSASTTQYGAPRDLTQVAAADAAAWYGTPGRTACAAWGRCCASTPPTTGPGVWACRRRTFRSGWPCRRSARLFSPAAS